MQIQNTQYYYYLQTNLLARKNLFTFGSILIVLKARTLYNFNLNSILRHIK